MKNGIPLLIAMAALSCCGTALAATDGKSAAQPAATAPAASSATTESAAQTDEMPPLSGPELKAKKVRPKDLDLRSCLELKDNAAIVKCAGE